MLSITSIAVDKGGFEPLACTSSAHPECPLSFVVSLPNGSLGKTRRANYREHESSDGVKDANVPPPACLCLQNAEAPKLRRCNAGTPRRTGIDFDFNFDS